MQTRRLDMCSGPIAMPMLRYTIPIFLTGLLQRFFVAADMILASDYPQKDGSVKHSARRPTGN